MTHTELMKAADVAFLVFRLSRQESLEVER